ncbi:hypothetical protein FQA39_LY11357 [Lamprigera yunnana]|nr:hypothetical protein FQA39_LY11357 [Lamprigera yunnana]
MAITLFTWIDYVIFILLTAIGCGLGLYFGLFGKQITVSDYLFGGKRMNWIPITLSLTSSLLPSVTLIGLPTEIYLHGTQITLVAFSFIPAAVVNQIVFLPIFYKLQLVNVYDYLEMRFHKYFKNFASFIAVLSGIFVLPFLMYAPSLILSQASGVDLHVITPIMMLICIFYTTIGGAKGIIWADTFQFLVTLITLVVVIVTGITLAGGVGKVFARAKEGDRLEFLNFSLNPTIRTTFWSSLIAHIFTSIANSAISPPVVQRFISLPTRAKIKWSLWTFTIALGLSKGICYLLGIIIYSYYHDCDPKAIGHIEKPDQIVPYYIMEITSGIIGLSALFTAALFGQAFSSLSTMLNAFSAIIYSNFTNFFTSTELLKRQPTISLKIISVIIGIASIGLIYVLENMGTMFEVMYYIKGITDGGLLGIYLLGALFPMANSKGALGGGITSVILMAIIAIRTQIYLWNGAIVHSTKTLNTYGCNFTNNVTFINTTTETIAALRSPQEEPLWLFRISFQYYHVLGTITTIIIGLLISWITSRKSDFDVNPDLLSPVVHRFLKKNVDQEPPEKIDANEDKVNEELSVPVSDILENPPDISKDDVLDQPDPSKRAKLD